MSSGNLLSTPGDGAREALAALSLNAQPPAQPVGKECATPAPWSATGALVSSGGLVGTPEFNKCVSRAARPWRSGRGGLDNWPPRRLCTRLTPALRTPSLRSLAALAAAEAAAEKLRAEHSELERKKREGACAQQKAGC